jgi:invasion protein IalB
MHDYETCNNSIAEHYHRFILTGKQMKFFAFISMLASNLLFSGLVIDSYAAEIVDLDARSPMKVKTHRDWQVFEFDGLEKGAGSCFATHATLLRDSGVTLATITIYAAKGPAAEENPAVMTVKVPIGASLVSGISYQHRNLPQPMEFEWQYCTQEICLASAGISKSGIDQLKKARDFLLGYRPLPGSRPLVIPVSLLGFTRAWQELQNCTKR